MRPKSGVNITSMVGKALNIVGTTIITVILARILEVDLGDIKMISGDIYQFFMRMDVISGF